jgi:hypothetical protein
MKKEKFVAYEKVKESGLTNMLDINEVRFIAASKYGQILSHEDCFSAMLHYDKYKAEYGLNRHKKDVHS